MLYATNLPAQENLCLAICARESVYFCLKGMKLALNRLSGFLVRVMPKYC